MTGDLEGEGTVFWITGLSGSGKTTVGGLFYRRLRAGHPNSVFLDGDQLRRAVADDLGYSIKDRRRCARRYGRLGRLLASQGTHVILATISMFSECRAWNRLHIPNYCEIYLKSDLEILRRRDSKGLYGDRSQPGETVGVDLPFEEPMNADLVIENNGAAPPRAIAEDIWERVQPWL